MLNTVVALFAISLLIGCVAPLMAIINCTVLLPERREIAAASPVHLVLAYTAIGISVLYLILMLLFALILGGFLQ